MILKEIGSFCKNQTIGGVAKLGGWRNYYGYYGESMWETGYSAYG